MPKYMDIHRNVKGITQEGLEKAHQKDLEIQAFNKEAHGGVADEIISIYSRKAGIGERNICIFRKVEII